MQGQSQAMKSGIIPLEENCSMFFMIFQMFHQTFDKLFVQRSEPTQQFLLHMQTQSIFLFCVILIYTDFSRNATTVCVGDCVWMSEGASL